MKAVCYLRVSTDEQSTDMQRQDIQRYCDYHNLSPTFFEDIMSGKKDDRPQFQEMMRQIHEGKFQKLIIWKLDRFSRRMNKLVMLFDELRQIGCEVISLKENLEFSTPAGRMFANLMAVLAEYEREMIVERTKCGLNAAKARGVKLGPKPKSIDFITYQELKSLNLSPKEIANKLGFSRAQLYKRLKAGA